MKRKAILIGSNFDTKISGVKADIVAWRDFLLSPLGGAWAESELEILEDARTSQEVIEAINSATYVDYALISFSGHGGIYKRGKDSLGLQETFIYLSENEILSERQLNPGRNCPRCTILLDCCRKHVAELGFLSKKSFAMEDVDDKIKSFFRDIFDKQLEISDKGCVKIYSTEIDHVAADADSFSRILIESAKSYMKKTPNCHILELNKAIEIASKSMALINPQQTAQYIGGRRHTHFPFAVNPIING